MDNVGFIMLRHVKDNDTNLYWQESYNCIRKLYPENKIVIIDSNSKREFISDIELHKTEIIYSTYTNRGECLPYYYYTKNKWFEKAVIIHDTVFIHHYIDFSDFSNYKLMWGFKHGKYERKDEAIQIIRALDNSHELKEFYLNNDTWYGCFGSMTTISHKFLSELNDKYDFENFLYVIISKQYREAFERVISCIFQFEYEAKFVVHKDMLLYLPYGISFEVRNHYSHLPIIKTWGNRK